MSSLKLHISWKNWQLPYPEREIVTSWSRVHPELEKRLYTDDDNKDLLIAYFPWFLATYNDYPYDIQKADAMRYFYLYLYGGIYSDADYEIFKRIPQSIFKSNCLVARKEDSVTNFLMFGNGGRGFWGYVISKLTEAHRICMYDINKKIKNVFLSTGPTFLSSCYRNYQGSSKPTILDARDFDPYSRHSYAIAPKTLRSMMVGRSSVENTLKQVDLPEELLERLHSCYGIHWRCSRWLR